MTTHIQGFWQRNDIIAKGLLSNRKFVGKLVAFSRHDAVEGLGHIGWGFKLSDGSYCYGATENPSNNDEHNPFMWIVESFHQGTTAQGGDNQAWIGHNDGVGMLQDMRNLGAGSYKYGIVHHPCPYMAHMKAVEALHCGYTGLTNNCLDAVCRVFAAYGGANFPQAFWNPTPNGWFNMMSGHVLATTNPYGVK